MYTCDLDVFVAGMLLKESLASIVVVIAVRRNSAFLVSGKGRPSLIVGGKMCGANPRIMCQCGINKRRLHSEFSKNRAT